jgi:hypothetical protein
MWLFTLTAVLLLGTLIAAPIFLGFLGGRQYRWWRDTHRALPH